MRFAITVVLNSAMLISAQEILFMWSWTRFFMFGSYAALLAVLCLAEMMGLMISTLVGASNESWCISLY